MSEKIVRQWYEVKAITDRNEIAKDSHISMMILRIMESCNDLLAKHGVAPIALFLSKQENWVEVEDGTTYVPSTYRHYTFSIEKAILGRVFLEDEALYFIRGVLSCAMLLCNTKRLDKKIDVNEKPEA